MRVAWRAIHEPMHLSSLELGRELDGHVTWLCSRQATQLQQELQYHQHCDIRCAFDYIITELKGYIGTHVGWRAGSCMRALCVELKDLASGRFVLAPCGDDIVTVLVL